jgi:hypothetical protein
MLANSRGTQRRRADHRVIDDKADDYQQTGVIAEGARIPIRSLKTDQKSVTFHKFGGGYEFTYEFERRVSLDVVTPYANRVDREVADRPGRRSSPTSSSTATASTARHR